MGKMSRRKGCRGEVEVAHAFTRAGLPARRGMGQARAANEVPDVDLLDGSFWPEVKRQKKFSPRAALAQAIEANEGRRVPIAVVWDDGEEPIVTMRFDDFLQLAWEAAVARDVVLEPHAEAGLGFAPTKSTGPRSPRGEWLRGPKRGKRQVVPPNHAKACHLLTYGAGPGVCDCGEAVRYNADLASARKKPKP